MPIRERHHRVALACPGERGTPGRRSDLALQLRSPVFAVATVLLSAVAHVLGGGAPPGTGTVLLLVLAVDVAFRAVARRELSLGGVAAGVGLTELLLHLALAASPTGHLVGLAEHAAGRHGGHAVQGPAAAVPGVLMMAAHAAATALLAWWLRRGEAAAWRSAHRLARALRLPPAPGRIDDHLAPARAPRVEYRPSYRRLLALAADPRRGPPRTA
jgi:hypothetical protein